MAARRNWLDWCRVICLYLVILGHTGLHETFLNTYLSNFRMPLFFLLSGYNRKRDLTLGAHFRRDLRTLLLPYAGFWLILYPHWLLAVAPRHPDLYALNGLGDAVLKPILGLLVGMGQNTTYSYAISAPLWFLVALFAERSLYNLFVWLLGGSPRRMLPVAAMLPIVAIALHSRGVDLPFSLGSALIAFPLYFTGILVRQGRFEPLARILRSRPELFAVVFFGLLFPIARLNGQVDLAMSVLGNSPFLFYPAALLGCLGMVELGLSLNKVTHPALVFLSKGSLVVMSLHLAFIALGKVVFTPFLIPDRQSDGVVASIELSVFAVLCCLPAVVVVRRFAPWLTGKWRRSASTA